MTTMLFQKWLIRIFLPLKRNSISFKATTGTKKRINAKAQLIRMDRGDGCRWFRVCVCAHTKMRIHARFYPPWRWWVQHWITWARDSITIELNPPTKNRISFVVRLVAVDWKMLANSFKTTKIQQTIHHFIRIDGKRREPLHSVPHRARVCVCGIFFDIFRQRSHFKHTFRFNDN